MPPERSSLASWTRLRSPPLSSATFFDCVSPLNPNHEQYARDITLAAPSWSSSAPPVTSSKTDRESVSPSRLWSTQTSLTDSPNTKEPSSGVSSPVSIRISVVFPAPFGPTTPTMPPGGSEKVRSSIRVRPPKALRTFVASITWVPRRGPGGT